MASRNDMERRSMSQLNPPWESDYLFSWVENGAQCLVCEKFITTVRKFQIIEQVSNFNSLGNDISYDKYYDRYIKLNKFQKICEGTNRTFRNKVH
jgi:hypothetical protein